MYVPKNNGLGRPAHPGKAAGMELLKQGWRVTAVAREVGVCPATAQNWKSELPRWQRASALEECQPVALGMLLQGELVRDVADVLGLTVQTARRWAREAGIRLRWRTPPAPDPITEVRREHGERLIREGWRDSDIGPVVGVSRERVRQWRAEMGAPQVPRAWIARHDQIDALLRAGVPAVQVARQLGAARSTVMRRVRALVDEPRPARAAAAPEAPAAPL